MSFGNFNIKDLKLGNAQVASVWYGASKLWPIVSTVTIAATAGEHILSIIGTGTYNYGDTVSLAAEVEDDCIFDGWYENGTLLSKDNPYTFTARKNLTLDTNAIEVPVVDVILDKFSLNGATDIFDFRVGNVVGMGVGDISTPQVPWSSTTAEISYKLGITGIYEGTEEVLSGATATATSSSFPQNTSDEEVIRDVTFVAADGNTYNAQVIQGAYAAASYEITLSGISNYGFVKSDTAMPNLDPTVYDGVYLSNNKGVNSSKAVARIDFTGMPEFTLWLNSYAEATYDYAVAGQRDATSYPVSYNDSYSENGYIKGTSSSDGKYANTAGYQKPIDATASAPVTSKWRKIVYANDGGSHHIFITYLKDSSVGSGDDRGAFIVQKG